MLNTERSLYHRSDGSSRGRPLKIRTGLRGRPRKLPAKSSEIQTSRYDRKSLTDLISRLQGSDPDLMRFVVIEKKRKSSFRKYYTYSLP